MNESRFIAMAWAALLLLVAQRTFAEPVTARKSLAEAVSQAASLRLDLKRSALDVEVAQGKVAEAEAHFYPTLDAAIDAQYARSYDSFTGISATVDLPVLGQATVDVTRTLPRYQVVPRVHAGYAVYAGGLHKAGLQRAQALLDAARTNQQIDLQSVTLEVSLAYFRLRRACTDWTGATAASELASREASLSRTRWEDGRLSELALRESELALAEKNHDTMSKAIAVRAAHAAYASAVRSQASADQDLGDTCRFDTEIAEDLQFASAMADDRPTRSRLEADTEAARQQVLVEQAAARPQVLLSMDYAYVGRSESSLTDSFSNIKRQVGSIGLTVSYNLFDGGLINARVDQARAQFQRKQLEQTLEMERINEAIEQSRSRRDQARAAGDMARSRLVLTSKRLAVAESRERDGSGTALATQSARTEALQARCALTLADLDLAISEVERLYAAASRSPRN